MYVCELQKKQKTFGTMHRELFFCFFKLKMVYYVSGRMTVCMVAIYYTNKMDGTPPTATTTRKNRKALENCFRKQKGAFWFRASRNLHRKIRQSFTGIPSIFTWIRTFSTIFKRDSVLLVSVCCGIY